MYYRGGWIQIFGGIASEWQKYGLVQKSYVVHTTPASVTRDMNFNKIFGIRKLETLVYHAALFA